MHLDPSTSAHLRVAPRRHGFIRRSAVLAIERVCAACGGRSFYRRRHLARGRFRIREEVVRVAGLSRGLCGWRVVQLSDFHAGRFLGQGDLIDVVSAVNQLEPELVVLTGDLITRNWREALSLVADLSRIRARFGCFAVFGNHDYRGRDEARIAEALGPAGVRFLRNEGVRIACDDGALCVFGIEDLEESRSIDLDAARALGREGDFELVLCHNPRGAHAFARRACIAVLCGHTHGTQLDLPWIRRAGPPHPGSRIELGSTRVIVSRGLGVIGVPLRIGAPAEIVVVRLERSEPR